LSSTKTVPVWPVLLGGIGSAACAMTRDPKISEQLMEKPYAKRMYWFMGVALTALSQLSQVQGGSLDLRFQSRRNAPVALE
jgi:hypothetical protein